MTNELTQVVAERDDLRQQLDAVMGEKKELYQNISELLSENVQQVALLRKLAEARPGGTYFIKWEAEINRVLKEDATDRLLAERDQRCREEGIYYAANRLLGAWEHGQLDRPAAEVADVATMLLIAVDELPDITPDDYSPEYAQRIMKQLREDCSTQTISQRDAEMMARGVESFVAYNEALASDYPMAMVAKCIEITRLNAETHAAQLRAGASNAEGQP